MPATADQRGVSPVSVPIVLMLCFVTAVALDLYALVFLRSLLVSDKGADLARTAAKGAHTLDRVLFERYEDIKVLATDRTFLDGAQKERTRRLRQYKELYGYYSWIGTTDSIGRIEATTDPVDGPGSRAAESASSASSASFLRVKQTGQVHVDVAPVSSETDEGLDVVFSAPLDDPRGNFRGVIISRMPLEHFRTILEQEGELQEEGGAIDWTLLDREGLVLLQKRQADSFPTSIQTASFSRVARGRERSGFVEDVRERDGTPVVTGFAKTGGYREFSGFGWIVLIQVDRAHAYEPINKLVWMVGLTGLMIVAPLTGFGIFASRKLTRERQELLAARQELEQSITELSRSNSDLQQFAYVASHDLQEPLRMVASYTQLLAKRYRGKLDGDADEFIAYAVNGANRMQALIQDLLAVSRVDRQGQRFEPTSVEALVGYALDNLKGAIEESGAVITHDPLPMVMADERQFLHVLQNLLSNAIKFRGSGPPRAHVSAERRGGEWLFSVRDNGIGIDPQYAERIFVIFQRLHTNAEYPGTGIGLSLCKKIVERHGGRMWMESQLGHGATFYFTVPARDLPS
jgi:histidine kinase/DNA gyrase B/HSP90-like ATPase/phospho-acceptor domain-containing protein